MCFDVWCPAFPPRMTILVIRGWRLDGDEEGSYLSFKRRGLLPPKRWSCTAPSFFLWPSQVSTELPPRIFRISLARWLALLVPLGSPLPLCASSSDCRSLLPRPSYSHLTSSLCVSSSSSSFGSLTHARTRSARPSVLSQIIFLSSRIDDPIRPTLVSRRAKRSGWSGSGASAGRWRRGAWTSACTPSGTIPSSPTRRRWRRG